MSVVQSHYRRDPERATREQIYAAGESVAAWLGLSAWTDIPLMQSPEHVDRLRQMIRER